MAKTVGKKFEEWFKRDWDITFPDGIIFRIPDQVSKKKGSENLCDFFAFNNKTLYLLECKATKVTTFNFAKLKQYSRMLPYKDYENVHTGVMIYFYTFDKIFYVPIETVRRMKQDGKKSVNVNKSIKEGYNIKVIPTTKRRVYVSGDYSLMSELERGE